METELHELYKPNSNVFLYTNTMLIDKATLIKQKQVNHNDTKIAKNIINKYKVFLKLISIS